MKHDVVVAGASGFVGRHLIDRLRQDGHRVRCGTRNPARARAVRPGINWVELDVRDAESLKRAFDSASALVFLVHMMRDAKGNLVQAEVEAAERVARVAEQAGLQHIVYLGGPRSTTDASVHLEARSRTGEILRSGGVRATELRSGMVIGAGSESWMIVRDLALRLPVMVLPQWLQHRSQPLWIGDVISALVHALESEDEASAWYDLPGPETLSAQQILERVAAQAGMRPLMLPIPVLTPSLSSHWIRVVTRADFRIAQQLVHGLMEDLVCPDDGYWVRMPDYERLSFDEAARSALAAEVKLGRLGAAWEAVARRVSRGA